MEDNLPVEVGSAAENRLMAAVTETEGMLPMAGRAPRQQTAELAAAAGKGTGTAAESREADPGGAAAGLGLTAGDMEMGTAGGVAEAVVVNRGAGMTEAGEAETEFAFADKKAEHVGPEWGAAGHKKAVAGGEDSAGYNKGSDSAARNQQGPAVRKAVSVWERKIWKRREINVGREDTKEWSSERYIAGSP